MSVRVCVCFYSAVKPVRRKVIPALRQGKNLLAGLSTSSTGPVCTLPTCCTSTILSPARLFWWMILWIHVFYSTPLPSQFVFSSAQSLCYGTSLVLPPVYFKAFLLHSLLLQHFFSSSRTFSLSSSHFSLFNIKIILSLFNYNSLQNITCLHSLFPKRLFFVVPGNCRSAPWHPQIHIFPSNNSKINVFS